MIKVLALCFAIVGCSKSNDAPKAAPAPTPAPVSPADAAAEPDAAEVKPMAADVDFAKLEYEEKIDFMKKRVVPRMKKLFQEFDPVKYEVFGCKTCHGKNPQAVKYEMPNPGLPKLDFAALEAGKQEPKIAEFMSKTVKPEMARILNVPEHTESRPNGFGCLECHEQKK